MTFMPLSQHTQENLLPKRKWIEAFRNKVVLITGGSSGIGLATARLFAACGAQLWLIARRQELLDSAVQAIHSVQLYSGQRCGYSTADVAKLDQVVNAIEQANQALGLPDIVINSAGITFPGYIQNIDLSVFHELMEVNYFGTVNVVKTLLPGMLARGSGHIVMISSLAGLLGIFGYSAYGATKYALRGFSDVLRAEMKLRQIQVSIVYPPDTDTPQLAYENQFKPFETRAVASNAGLLSPNYVARCILDGVQRKKYLIMLNLESKLIYLLGGVLNPYLDYLAARARKRRLKQQP